MRGAGSGGWEGWRERVLVRKGSQAWKMVGGKRGEEGRGGMEE